MTQPQNRPAGAWHPDPAGRHEQRYWDGDGWTSHVHTRGVAAVDHLQAPANVAAYAVPHGGHTVVVHNTVVPQKSVGVALILAFFFGPIGLLYASVIGGLIMLVVSVILAVLTLGISLLLTVPVTLIWAGVAANGHNKGALAHQQTTVVGGYQQPQYQQPQYQQPQYQQAPYQPPLPGSPDRGLPPGQQPA